ncbi:MAG: methionine gamma-lyase family protein [Eubacteriales bacterium]
MSPSVSPAALADEAEAALQGTFREIDRRAEAHTAEILRAFQKHRVSAAMFAPTDGYGYDDRGRDTLELVWAEVFGAEAALVRHQICSGTHALAIGLFGLLRPGDVLLSLTGKPYDTLDEVIGLRGVSGAGSLADFGVRYEQVELLPDGLPDSAAIRAALARLGRAVKVAFIQRSKGYANRQSLSVAQIGELARLVKDCLPDTYVVVDNCYGEFADDAEPSAVGADLVIGSLIKNPGGGMAESGGYLAGTRAAVDLCAGRLTAPGVGAEIGASLGQNKSLFKGLFYAPHSVAQALKTMHFAAYLFEGMGLVAAPRWQSRRYDIIQTIECGSAEKLVALCRGIQHGSPVDAFLSCEPWDMPGYSDPVIMAAGTFTQGASLELSADGPLRPPYTAYLQGGLTYESGKFGILSAAEALLRLR